MPSAYTAEEITAFEVAHDASHLDLVHRVNQGGRGTGLAEDVAHIGDLGDRRAFPVQGFRDLYAQEAQFADFSECLARKTRFGIDCGCIGARHVGRSPGAGRQVALAGTRNAGAG
jgi:hypothetical protein